MIYDLKFKNVRQVFFIFVLIAFALIERLWFDLGPNIELITLTTFIAAFYLNLNAALIVGVLSLAVSDIFLGNTNIALFTWSAYATIALGAYFIKSFAKSENKKIILATGGAIAACLWFYIWTNFGVWFLDGWNMYPDTLNGLLQSYINGLPFLKLQLVGNLITIPSGFLITESIFGISVNNDLSLIGDGIKRIIS